jgi:hypothetical protein
VRIALYSREDFPEQKVVLIRDLGVGISVTNSIEEVFKAEKLSQLTDWVIVQKDSYGDYDIVTIEDGTPKWTYLYHGSNKFIQGNLSEMDIVKRAREKVCSQ